MSKIKDKLSPTVVYTTVGVCVAAGICALTSVALVKSYNTSYNTIINNVVADNKKALENLINGVTKSTI